jgi:hypothetical protein
MKPRSGVKLRRLYLRSTIWIAANRMKESGVRLGGEQAPLARVETTAAASNESMGPMRHLNGD